MSNQVEKGRNQSHLDDDDDDNGDGVGGGDGSHGRGRGDGEKGGTSSHFRDRIDSSEDLSYKNEKQSFLYSFNNQSSYEESSYLGGSGSSGSFGNSVGNSGGNGNIDDESGGNNQKEKSKKLGLVMLCAITYFLVSGGPYGLENMVGTVPNPFYVILFFILFPIFYALPMSLVCAELATAIPDNGGVFAWIYHAFGHFMSFQVGFSVTVTYVLDISLYPVMFVMYLEEMIGGELQFFLKWMISCAVVISLTIVNVIGLEIVGFVSILFIIAVTSPFFVLPILGIQYLNPMVILREARNFPMENVDWGYFLTLLIWNNSGWLSPGFLAGETKNTRTTYPRAMIISMIFANATYIIPVVIGVCINRDWENWEIGYFAKVAKQVGGTWLMMWITVASMCTNAGLFNAAVSTSSRSIASMAEKSFYPKILAYELPYLKTPLVSILVDCFATCVLVALPFATIIGAQACINSISMILLYMAFIFLRFREPKMKRPYRVPLNNVLSLFMCLIPMGISIWNIITSDYISLISTAITLLIGLIIYLIKWWRDVKALIYKLKMVRMKKIWRFIYCPVWPQQ